MNEDAKLANRQVGEEIVGIVLSRSTAAVEIRERLSAPLDTWAMRMKEYVPALGEWALLTTCHRFELYFSVGSALDAEARQAIVAQARALLDEFAGVDAQGRLAQWRVLEGRNAVHHLCRVAAGLDSAILGEAQIQGQVSDAYSHAMEQGTVGPLLASLFRTAIRAGKRARTETPIGRNPASLSSIALNLAATHMGDLRHVRVLVIGAGEMSQLALKALQARGASRVTVANRTLAHAQQALLDPDWQAVDLSYIPYLLEECDVVLAATSAPGHVVTAAQVAAAQARRADCQRRLLLIDLAVPRDIDPALREMADIVLLDVDDVRESLGQSLAGRSQAVPAVDAIIAQEICQWHAEARELTMRPLVAELRQRAERIRQAEVARTLRHLGQVDDDTEHHIHHLSRALVNKLLHEPTVRMKALAQRDQDDVYLSALCDIFGLDTPAQQFSQYGAQARGDSISA